MNDQRNEGNTLEPNRSLLQSASPNEVNQQFANNFPITIGPNVGNEARTESSTKERNYTAQTAVVAEQKRNNEGANTKKAFDPKIAEFKSYLECIYRAEFPDTWFLTNPEKVFGFMYYQANRTKRKGRNKIGFFDKTDFENTMAFVDDDTRDVIGPQAVNQYICAIRKYAQQQFDDGLIEYRREDLMTSKLKDLIHGVNNRCERVLKKQFKERITDDFEPYRLLSDIPKIEDFIWNEHCGQRIYGANGLRDRFQLLFSLSAVLRSDSIYKADLADLCDFKFKQKLEPDPYHICILRVGEGKTVGSKAQFGKMMRHSNTKMCAIGALGFWLLARFMITDEIGQMDFTNNDSWFNVKLLCAVDKNHMKKNSELKIVFVVWMSSL